MARKRKRRRLKTISGVADIDHQLNLAKHDPAQRMERMNRPASDYPQHIHDLLKQLPNMTELEALDAMLQLQKLVAGDAALLNNPDMSQNVAKLREKAAERDRVKEAYETDRMRFIENTIAESEKIKPTGETAEQVKARGQKMMQEAIQNATNLKHAKARVIDMMLDTGPTETIHVAPKTVMTGQGPVILATKIKIAHRTFILQPGVNEVPFLVAQEYRNATQAAREQRMRDHAYKSGSHLGKIEQKMQEIDREFGTGHEVDPRIAQMVKAQNQLMPD